MSANDVATAARSATDCSTAAQLNLNQNCRVILLQRGVDGLREYFHGLGLDAPDYSVRDVYEAPLWEIMSTLGTKCFMGPQPPFETTFEVDPLML